MLISYTGPKDSKFVQFSNGDQKEYQFIGHEPLEVSNQEHQRFFLHPDRKGLFQIVKTAPNAPGSTQTEKDGVVGQDSQENSTQAEQDAGAGKKKSGGRPKKDS